MKPDTRDLRRDLAILFKRGDRKSGGGRTRPAMIKRGDRVLQRPVFGDAQIRRSDALVFPLGSTAIAGQSSPKIRIALQVKTVAHRAIAAIDYQQIDPARGKFVPAPRAVACGRRVGRSVDMGRQAAVRNRSPRLRWLRGL